MNPDCLRDMITFEQEHSIILNVLFVEKSKFVRKVVENFFIIISQSKSIDQMLTTGNIPVPFINLNEKNRF